MSASSPQREPQDQSPKRIAILEAALHRFAALGVNGVAVPDIAAAAQVGTGTIYRYFQNKEALVNALFQEEKFRFQNHLLEGLPKDGEPRELFNRFWEKMVSFAREHPLSFHFLELQDHLPYLDNTSKALEREVLKRLAAPCRALQERGIFRSDIRAEIIMATVWGAFVNLMKAETAGYIQLSQADIDAARDGCWRLSAANP